MVLRALTEIWQTAEGETNSNKPTNCPTFSHFAQFVAGRQAGEFCTLACCQADRDGFQINTKLVRFLFKANIVSILCFYTNSKLSGLPHLWWWHMMFVCLKSATSKKIRRSDSFISKLGPRTRASRIFFLPHCLVSQPFCHKLRLWRTERRKAAEKKWQNWRRFCRRRASRSLHPTISKLVDQSVQLCECHLRPHRSIGCKADNPASSAT